MNISTFDDLLQAARAQATPQRLLLVFTRAELPDDASPDQQARFDAGQGGALVPLMCVDKMPDALESFQTLAEEARQMGQAWDIVFAAAISIDPQGTQSEAAVSAALEKMVAAIKAGTIGAFIPFERHGHAVALR